MLKDTACRLPHHRPTPPPFIFLKPQTGSGFLRPIFMRTSVAGMSRGNLPAKHAIVPAAQFYADIRCGSASQEPSSKTCHVSAMMFSLWGIGQEGARLEFLGGNCVARIAILVNLN